MKVYIVWSANGFGNKAIVAVTLTPEKANEICKQANSSQYRYDNSYYYEVREVDE